MIVVIDANIVISGIIKPFGPIPRLLLQKNDILEFVLPEYALEEILAHQKKICKAAGIARTEFSILINALLVNVVLYTTESIDTATFKQAIKITQSIDVKDIVYIAFCVALDAILWTGDLMLYRGLRRNGFMNIVTTKELTEIYKGLK